MFSKIFSLQMQNALSSKCSFRQLKDDKCNYSSAKYAWLEGGLNMSNSGSLPLDILCLSQHLLEKDI